MTEPTPLPPGDVGSESTPVAAAEAGAVAPLLVSGIEAVARSRLVEVAARLSDAQISVVVACDDAVSVMGPVTENLLVRHLGLGHADFFATHAGDVMMQKFTTCAPHELLSDELAMMHACKPRRPVNCINC